MINRTMKQPELKHLRNVFKKYPEIKAVYLFGSTASGNLHRESDIDLAVLPGTDTIRKQKLQILTDLAREGFCNVDLVFLDDNTDIVMRYEAVKQNKIVYMAPGFDRGSTYSKIVRQYLDFYPYLVVQRKAYKQRILDGKL